MRKLKYLFIVLAVLLVAAAGFAFAQVHAFDQSMDTVYQVPVPQLSPTTDPAALARGKHLIESIGGCSTVACHGADLGGGKPTELGPLGTLAAPNLTPGHNAAAYSDGELARLIQHGIKKDGHSLIFMPAQHMSWLPDADVAAIVAYLRTVPAVDRPNGQMEIKPLMKILDRLDQLEADVARRIDHAHREVVPAPEPTAEYGQFIVRQCKGCHGNNLSGGPIPGAPPELPTPLNLTPHATGLKDWTYADYEKLMREGIRKNGKKLDPFMPIEAWSKLDATELRATWEALQKTQARPFGER